MKDQENFQSSEVIRDLSQSAEEKIKGMIEGNNDINAKNVWQNKIEARRASIRGRGM